MIAGMRICSHLNIICMNYNFHETLTSLFQLIVVFVLIMLPNLVCNFDISFCTNLRLFYLRAKNCYFLNENVCFCHVFIFKQNY